MKVAIVNHKSEDGNDKTAEEPVIAISAHVVFKGKAANPGCVFFVATFQRWESTSTGRTLRKYEEAYQVMTVNIGFYGRHACEASVREQVRNRHFGKQLN